MRTLILSLFIFIQLGLSAQSNDQIFEALSTKNISFLSERFTDKVDICLDDKQDFVSKKKAISTLQLFLDDINPRKIVKKHKGASDSKNTNYRVATLVSEKGKYRVFIYYEKVGGEKKISEIRMDKI